MEAASSAELIYMNYSARTPVEPRVVEQLVPFLYERLGNPASRSHSYGWAAEQAVEITRRHVAALLNAPPRETGPQEGLRRLTPALLTSMPFDFDFRLALLSGQRDPGRCERLGFVEKQIALLGCRVLRGSPQRACAGTPSSVP